MLEISAITIISNKYGQVEISDLCIVRMLSEFRVHLHFQLDSERGEFVDTVVECRAARRLRLHIRRVVQHTIAAAMWYGHRTTLLTQCTAHDHATPRLSPPCTRTVSTQFA